MSLLLSHPMLLYYRHRSEDAPLSSCGPDRRGPAGRYTDAGHVPPTFKRPPRSTEELMRQVRARRVAHPGDGQGKGMYMCIRLLWTDGVA